MPNNPSAFPSPGVVMPGYNETFFQQGAYEGMSLRDWFAGMALNGLCAGFSQLNAWPDDRFPESYEVAAEHSYTLADAMLRQREATNGC